MSTFKVTYNIVGVLGWSALLLTSLQHIITTKNFHILQSDNVWKIVQLVQSMQVLEIIMSLLRITRSPVLASLVQVIARMFVVFLVFPFVKDSDYPALAIIPWCLADLIRSLYYTNVELKINNNFIEWLRYSAFLILYPIGISGEFMSANLALEKISISKIYYDQSFTILDYEISLSSSIKVFRALCVPGMVVLYVYLLKQRSKLNKKKTNTKKSN